MQISTENRDFHLAKTAEVLGNLQLEQGPREIYDAYNIQLANVSKDVHSFLKLGWSYTTH